MRNYPAIETEDFALNGFEFRLETFRDDDMREPCGRLPSEDASGDIPMAVAHA
jgi:hypothetical protein